MPVMFMKNCVRKSGGEQRKILELALCQRVIVEKLFLIAEGELKGSRLPKPYWIFIYVEFELLSESDHLLQIPSNGLYLFIFNLVNDPSRYKVSFRGVWSKSGVWCPSSVSSKVS